MTTAKEKSVSEDQTKGVLSAEDLFAGGDEPIQRLELPMIIKNGVPGVVFIRKINMGEVLAHKRMTEGEEKSDNELRLITMAVAKNIEGDPMFTSEHDSLLEKIPAGAFGLMSQAMLGDLGLEVKAGDDVNAEKKG